MLDPFAAPLAKLLVVAGLGGLGAALLGKFKDWFALSSGQRVTTGVVSGLVLVSGLGFAVLRPEDDAPRPDSSGRVAAATGAGVPAPSPATRSADPGTPASTPAVRPGEPINGPGAVGPRLAPGSTLSTPLAQVTELRLKLPHGRGQLLGLRALQPLDLSQATVGMGEGAGAMRLPAGVVLAAGEELQLYTGAAVGSPGGAHVVGLRLDAPIWRVRHGETDRVLIRDSQGRAVSISPTAFPDPAAPHLTSPGSRPLWPARRGSD